MKKEMTEKKKKEGEERKKILEENFPKHLDRRSKEPKFSDFYQEENCCPKINYLIMKI
ncbi:MAG: hypothetical protein ABH971_03050 [bacterium]